LTYREGKKVKRHAAGGKRIASTGTDETSNEESYNWKYSSISRLQKRKWLIFSSSRLKERQRRQSSEEELSRRFEERGEERQNEVNRQAAMKGEGAHNAATTLSNCTTERRFHPGGSIKSASGKKKGLRSWSRAKKKHRRDVTPVESESAPLNSSNIKREGIQVTTRLESKRTPPSFKKKRPGQRTPERQRSLSKKSI